MYNVGKKPCNQTDTSYEDENKENVNISLQSFNIERNQDEPAINFKRQIKPDGYD